MTPYYEREEWPAFLAAIRAAPDDDLPRLVAADWLDEMETDEAAERAEFIRLQVELAKPQFFTRAGNPRLRRKRAARERARSILLRYAAVLAPGVEVVTSDKWRRTLGNTSAAVWYERGFVTRVSAPLAVLNGGGCRGGCEGGGRWAEWGTSRPCPHCRGTGRTPGVLGELLKQEPIVAAGIEVTDREPWPNSANGQNLWLLSTRPSTEIPDPARLPLELFNLIQPDRTRVTAAFPTADAARLALGEALYRLHGPKSEVTT